MRRVVSARILSLWVRVCRSSAVSQVSLPNKNDPPGFGHSEEKRNQSTQQVIQRFHHTEATANLASKIRREMGLTMQTTLQMLRTFLSACRPARTTIALGLVLMVGFAQSGLAQTASTTTGTNPLNIFKNYFVTGDYVVAGWVEQSSDGHYATGMISIPDTKQPDQTLVGVPNTVPVGADIVAAYLYWATVEKSKTAFAGQNAFFNGYSISGTILGNPNAPVSWSSGGCAGASNGTTTMRTYRADVRPYLPVDTDPTSPTFSAFLPNGSFQVKLTDSGSNGNTAPNALGATLVIIYRVLNPPPPLNAIVLYDGAYAPSNTSQITGQTMIGFYEPALHPVAKLTHIVANGQPNKSELVYLNNLSQPLTSLYTGLPPFPGIYGSWDNPTWNLGNYVNGGNPNGGTITGFDTTETTSVVPSASNSGCVSWGAMILSTTVQDTDGDGLLDTWESKQGYTDAVSNSVVALPGADPNQKDIFVELDYLVNYVRLLDGTIAVQHSHLPKQAALDAVGKAFANQKPPIKVHFDVGNVYQSPLPGGDSVNCGAAACDPYIISNPAGTGGNSISEGTLLCTDDGITPPLCAFPGQPAIGWKGDFAFVRDSATMPNTNPPAPLGNFQAGRGQSYHYVLFGHSLGDPRSFWSAYGAKLADPTIPQLVSIQNTGNTATVTIQTPSNVQPPPGVITLYPKPGDCPNAPPLPAFCDANYKRVTITGALGTPNPAPGILSPQNLNGTYLFTCNQPCSTFTITTSGVPDGIYNFSNEPQLGVAYLGPTSTSGHSDFGGGGDSAVTLGLWGADDPVNTGLPNCQADPSQPLGQYPAYCNNQVGTTAQQTGTLLHELGHTLTLTHGGTYYNDPINNPSYPTYELNCKSNFLSVMNYLFQVRGFVDGGFDYSGQSMPPLNELSPPANVQCPSPSTSAAPGLCESAGIGLDMLTSASAAHLTRWYSAPNALDTQLQNTTGGRYAKSHCDGTPLTSADVPGVRVDGSLAAFAGSTFSGPLDWNNDLIVANDPIKSPGVDVNYNGATGDSPFSGLNDWQILNPTPAANGVALQQMGARANAFAFSGGGGTKFGNGGGTKFGNGGGVDVDGGSGTKFGNGGGTKFGNGGGTKFGNGGGVGVEQDEDTANSTVDAPSGLTCSIPQNGVPGCVNSQGNFLENAKVVPLTWTYPGSTQIRRADVFRAVGSFPTSQQVAANFSKFTNIKTLSGTPPASSYTDPNVKNGTTYTYYVTDKNKQGAQSGASTPLVVTVKF